MLPDHRQSLNFQHAKDLQLAVVLILIVIIFFVCHLTRLLLNFWELSVVNEMIQCSEDFVPPTWFFCSTSVNHLLVVLNCIGNFVVYCCFNENYRSVLFGKKATKTMNGNNADQEIKRGAAAILSTFKLL